MTLSCDSDCWYKYLRVFWCICMYLYDLYACICMYLSCLLVFVWVNDVYSILDIMRLESLKCFENDL